MKDNDKQYNKNRTSKKYQAKQTKCKFSTNLTMSGRPQHEQTTD